MAGMMNRGGSAARGPLTLADLEYAQQNGLAIPHDWYQTSLPEGYEMRLRRSGLVTPRWEYKGPTTRGNWWSTGFANERDARIFVWDVVDRGITLAEALESLPASSADEADKALLTFFGGTTPLRDITQERAEALVEARRLGIYFYKSGRRRPCPKDETIRRDLQRLHSVLAHAQAKGKWHGNLVAFEVRQFALKADAEEGVKDFIDEYDEIRASMPSEGLRLVLDFLTAFATDACAAYNARLKDIHIDAKDICPKHPYGYIDIHGTKTPERGLPKPLNAQTRVLVERLARRVKTSEEKNPVLFPEMRWKTGTQRKISRYFRRWPRYEAYRKRGHKLTCMALRRTCFTALRRYWARSDCSLYVGHKVKGSDKPYDKYPILDLGKKMVEDDVEFPFLPPAEEGGITPLGSAAGPRDEKRADPVCAVSATGQGEAQVAEKKGDSEDRNPPL